MCSGVIIVHELGSIDASMSWSQLYPAKVQASDKCHQVDLSILVCLLINIICSFNCIYFCWLCVIMYYVIIIHGGSMHAHAWLPLGALWLRNCRQLISFSRRQSLLRIVFSCRVAPYWRMRRWDTNQWRDRWRDLSATSVLRCQAA
jgi:hypothetical protein